MTVRPHKIVTVRQTFRYRAHRKYIHSTDIYLALLRAIAELFPGRLVGSISISFREMATTQLAIQFGHSERGMQGSHRPVEFCVDIGGEELLGWMEEVDAPVVENKPYDEDVIRAGSVVGDRQVTLTGKCDAEPIEVLTSLSVHLHERCFPASAGRKWLLTRLELDHPLTKDEVRNGICIKISRLVGGRLSRSDILCGEVLVGKVMFAAG